MAEEKSVCPKIPGIPVVFKPCDGGLVAEVDVDLGVLGIHGLEIRVDEKTLKEFDSDPAWQAEVKEEAKREIQYAFGELLLKYAAVVLVNRGEGLLPMANRYEVALQELKG